MQVEAGIELLINQTLQRIENSRNEITFHTIEGKVYKMFHYQECCEDVVIEDICGDFHDLIGEPILLAEQVTEERDDEFLSYTWTFYKISTIKGTVTIRWLGESNGYYSTDVDFKEVTGCDESPDEWE